MDAFERARRDRDEVFSLGVPDPSRSSAGTGMPGPADAGRGARPRMFTPFLIEDQERAATLAERLAAEVDVQAALDDDERLAIVMGTARNLAAQGDAGMVRHALGLFLTHHPLGRKLTVPSLLGRTAAAAAMAATPLPDVTLGSGADGEEARLDWFREDPLLNEHHEHWHLVYPNRRGAGQSIYKVKERHGELFYYMHQQMLARYDVERVALGMGKVDPVADYDAPLGAGYDPGRLAEYGFSPRATDSVMVPFDGISPATHDAVRARLQEGIAGRALFTEAGERVDLEGHLGSNTLGLTTEATEATVDAAYGNHHGNGHVLIGDLERRPGVILAPATAVRDPAFWRWHRHVDNLHFGYQDALPPHDFGDRPAVALDALALSLERSHPGSDQEGADLSAAAQAALLGGVDTLETLMRGGAYQLLDGKRYRYDFLSHEPFLVAVRLRNPEQATKAVTLRFFLLPDSLFDVHADPTTESGRQMRRFAIELDKVRVRVEPGTHPFARSGRQMSVIRRPAVVDPTEVIDLDGERLDADARTCTCGWPFGLLLPRGTAEGMPFHLFAMATDNELDKVGGQKKCGSMSFCGVGDEYPDARPMGYPFDRPLSKPLAAIVAGNPNMRLLPVAIRWSKPMPATV